MDISVLCLDLQYYIVRNLPADTMIFALRTCKQWYEFRPKRVRIDIVKIISYKRIELVREIWREISTSPVALFITLQATCLWSDLFSVVDLPISDCQGMGCVLNGHHMCALHDAACAYIMYNKPDHLAALGAKFPQVYSDACDNKSGIVGKYLRLAIESGNKTMYGLLVNNIVITDEYAELAAISEKKWAYKMLYDRAKVYVVGTPVLRRNINYIKYIIGKRPKARWEFMEAAKQLAALGYKSCLGPVDILLVRTDECW